MATTESSRLYSLAFDNELNCSRQVDERMHGQETTIDLDNHLRALFQNRIASLSGHTA
jgi:hypothetical protein